MDAPSVASPEPHRKRTGVVSGNGSSVPWTQILQGGGAVDSGEDEPMEPEHPGTQQQAEASGLPSGAEFRVSNDVACQQWVNDHPFRGKAGGRLKKIARQSGQTGGGASG